MLKFLVSGIMNVETTLGIDSFPLEYNPVNYAFDRLKTNVSGVGMNVCKALSTLGNEVKFVSMIGEDLNAKVIINTCEGLNISTEYVVPKLKGTPQSVVIYDKEGRRQIHTDLKDATEVKYPEEKFDDIYKSCDILVLCNVNFSRYFLKKAKEAEKIIATDVHAISDIEDTYNKDFLQNADILFMSHEKINEKYENFVLRIAEKYNNKIIVVGLGSEGALLYVKEDNFIGRFSAYHVREVVNTVGAGDSLFASFLHFYAKSKNPYDSIKKAMLFAAYKIGENGASQGMISEDELIRIANEYIKD